MMLMMTLDTMTTMPIIMMMLVCCPEFNKLLLYCVCLYACVCVVCVGLPTLDLCAQKLSNPPHFIYSRSAAGQQRQWQ